MRRFTAILLICCLIWLLTWPVPIDPVAWVPPPAPEGDPETNNYLSDSRLIGEELLFGPEDVVAGPDGWLYTGTIGGHIYRLGPASRDVIRWVTLPDAARVGGMEFDANGNLLACAIDAGVVSVSPDAAVSVLVDHVQGRPLTTPNDLDVAPDGIIYFSELSSKRPLNIDAPEEFFEHRPRGTLYSFDPATRSVQVVLDGLYMANGVAVSPAGDFVLVAENANFAIQRVWLDDSGRAPDTFAHLPGVPDNLTFGDSGLLWLSIVPTSAILNVLAPRPFAMKVFYRLYTLIDPPLPTYSQVLAFDSAGNLIHNLQDPSGEAVGLITSVLEHEGMLYLGAHLRQGVGVVPRPD